MNTHSLLKADIIFQVKQALTEDIGDGDITAELIPSDTNAEAFVITREDCVLCGQEWVNEVFRQLDPSIQIDWSVQEGAWVKANSTLFSLKGSARHLLTGERTALNFLQFLSGTATLSHYYADLVKDTQVRLLDTRKTVPGLRTAQKYAVKIGGNHNHRIGLYDAYLIKENHIAACGGIRAAIQSARKKAPAKTVEIEVENLTEFTEAFQAGADIIMLDNFSLDDMKKAVEINDGKTRLEASGGITESTLRAIAETGVDFISIGALTKDVKSIDLSFRLAT